MAVRTISLASRGTPRAKQGGVLDAAGSGWLYQHRLVMSGLWNQEPWSAQDVLRLWKVEHKISSQHGGAGGADTAWIDVNPDAPPEWLMQYGGPMSGGMALLAKATGYEPPPITEEL